MSHLLSRFTGKIWILIKILLLYSAIMLLSSSGIYAQTTGKIVGRITDKKSGEPMIGTNVYLDGTILGASTDIDGFYIILNVPPEIYTLVVEQIGYRKSIIENVECRVNSTTTINVQLEEATIEGEEVVVVAEAPLIPKDQTGSKKVVSEEEIDLLPVTNVDQVVALQGGVVNGRFRGGRSDEVLYMIDGVPVNSAATGGRASSIGIEAVENLEVISGTFNAEYGRAMSGVVNAVTKAGSEEYHGNLEIYYGDYYSTYSLLGFDVYPENNSVNIGGIRDIRGSLEGPVPFLGKKFSFVLSGGSIVDDGYLTGNARNLFRPNTIHDPSSASVGVFNQTGDGEARKQNDFWAYDLLAKGHFQMLTSTSLSYSFLLNRFRGGSYNGFRRFVPDGSGSPRSETFNHIATLKHVFGARAFGTFKVAFLDENFDFYLADDPLSSAYLPGAYSQSDLTGNNLAIGGTDLFDFRRGSETLTLKGDLTWQIHRQHELKSGFEVLDHKLNEDGKVILFGTAQAFRTDSAAGLVDQWRRRVFDNELVTQNGTLPPIEYQYFHNNLAGDRNPYEAEAFQAAVYLQDKMEFSKVVINAGARFDYFDSEGRVPINTGDPNGALANPGLPRDQQLDRALKDAEIQTQLSPRLGLAYQVTQEGIVHFSYGHFFQIPPLTNLYTNPKFQILPGNISSAFIGNADLKAQRTITYELAYSDLVSENIAAEVTVFYRDIYDLLGLEILETDNDQLYARFTNVDYGNVKGAIFSLDLETGNFTATLDYTFQLADGNASDPGQTFVRAQAGQEPNLEAIRLDWDQRHTVVSTVNYNSDTFDGSIIASYGSGDPFDYVPLPAPGRPTLTETENNGQRPGNFNIDMNLGYKFATISGIDMRLYFQAYNLLDTRNPAFVFSDSGSPTSTGLLERRRLSLQNATFTTPEEIVFDGTSLVAPRQYRLGLGFRF